ncbi:MAG: DNA translocase FtsK [bacterium]|nr:DNA translocase FtsK [bacterium]
MSRNNPKRELEIEPPKQKRRWIIALVLIFFAIFWSISLATYSPDDWPESSGSGTTLNALGPAGSSWAYWSMQLLFGWHLTGVLPLLLFWFSVYLIIPSWRKPWLRGFLPVVAVGWLGASWVAYWQVHEFDFSTYREAGLLGSAFVEWLWQWLNGLGTALVLTFLTLLFIGLTVGNVLRRAAHNWLDWRSQRLAMRPVKPLTIEEKRQEKLPPSLPPPPVAEPVKKRKAQPVEEVVDEPLYNNDLFPVRPQIVMPKPTETVTKNLPVEPMIESPYRLPALDIFKPADGEIVPEPYEELAAKLLQTLREFNVIATVNTIHPGPVVTRYDFVPGPGVKVSSFANLSDDIARAMRAKSVRILAPIPGEEAVGIEIPNRNPRIVRFREVAESAVFQKDGWILPVAIGLTTDGQPLVTDLAKLPHLLVAGTTGSGKSVFINCLLASLLLRRTPSEVRIALIDPKQLELTPYKNLVRHHLVQLMGADPVVTKPVQAVKLLQACVSEMERRLELLTGAGVRDLREYQELHRRGHPAAVEPLCYIVVVVDELADLMLTAAKEVEDPIQRISQMARAVGIHLVVATQRPSVNVITGVIKANLPARLAFQVASQVDSRTILDQTGAEKLLGRGDALFSPPWEMKPLRVHCGLIESSETEKLLDWIAGQPPVQPLQFDMPRDNKGNNDDGETGDRDQLFNEAARVVVRAGQGSVAIIQRRLHVGYSRAGRLLDQLEQAGIVGKFDGSKPREVLIGADTLEEMLSPGDEE